MQWRTAEDVSFFCKTFEEDKIKWNNANKLDPTKDFVDRSIKWTGALESHLKKNTVISFHRHDKSGNRTDNITDWALEQFREHYPSLRGGPATATAHLSFSVECLLKQPLRLCSGCFLFFKKLIIC